MFLKKMLIKMDGLICSYLGLDREVITPNTVVAKKGRLLIRQTTAYKRHAFSLSWQAYCQSAQGHTPYHAQECLGRAAGRVIADQLTVSFKAPTIRIHHA